MSAPDPRLPPGLAVEATAPERLALAWGEDGASAVADALNAAGLMALRVAPRETPDLVSVSGAPALMAVEAPVLDDGAVDALEDVCRRSPYTRVVVLAGADTASPGLIRALRAGLSEVVDPHDPAAVADLVASETGRGADERVLAVGAHPDDVEIGCGAALLRHRSLGHPVTVLTLSRGAVGGPQDARRREAVGAAIEMSAELIMGDLPDTRMEDAHEMTSLVEAVVADVRPTTVYVHSQHDNHQDHRAVHASTVIAARRVPQLLCYQSPSSRNGFSPTTFVPVDETIDAKVKVLAHFRSQAARHYLEPDLVVATARYWSRQLTGHRYAEPFEVLRSTR